MTAPRLRRCVTASLRLCPLLLCAACSSDPSKGYSFTAARPDGIHTVAVPVFGNQTFQHGLETQLTDAIIKEIQRRTPWVVTSSGKAQTTLTGHISGAEMRTLDTSAKSGLIEEQAFELAVDFEWKDGSGKTLVARKNFRALETFIPERGTGERLELGEHAAVQELAHSIVNELRSTW